MNYLECRAEVANSLKSFTDKFGGTPMILYGSVGRRLQYGLSYGEPRTVSSLFCENEKHKTRPRTNERGLIDLDIGVCDVGATWKDVSNIAREITTQNQWVEIDPHLMMITNPSSKLVVKVATWLDGGVDLPLNPVSVQVDEDSDREILVPSLAAMLAYTFIHGNLRKKDVREIVGMISVIKETNEDWKSEAERTWWPYAMSYVRSRKFTFDILRMFYHSLSNEQIRMGVRRLRGWNQIDFRSFHNYDRIDPVYI